MCRIPVRSMRALSSLLYERISSPGRATMAAARLRLSARASAAMLRCERRTLRRPAPWDAAERQTPVIVESEQGREMAWARQSSRSIGRVRQWRRGKGSARTSLARRVVAFALAVDRAHGRGLPAGEQEAVVRVVSAVVAARPDARTRVEAVGIGRRAAELVAVVCCRGKEDGLVSIC